jgi:DNA-binding transcriptional LysR family regulator
VRQRSLQLKDFHEAPFIMYSIDGARYFHDLVTGLLNREQVSPANVHYMTQIHSILALVSSGLGAAMVPAAAQSLHFDGVKFRVIETTPPRPVELYLVWRKDSDNGVIRQFLELMRSPATRALLQ